LEHIAEINRKEEMLLFLSKGSDAVFYLIKIKRRKVTNIGGTRPKPKVNRQGHNICIIKNLTREKRAPSKQKFKP